MKKFTQTTLIALLIGTFVFAQKGSPGNQAAPSQTTVIVGALRGSVILLSPADGKSIAASDASKPVLFRWTAVSPKPKEPVTYRLKVWQLMQGQNGNDAMRSNQPVITKDVVNITQAAISNLYTGPCKPPYLCDFIWAVEVFNSDDKPAGKSDAYTFKYGGGIGTVTGSGGATVDIKSIDKELDKMQPTAKSIDKELDKNQPTAKSIDKESQETLPTTHTINLPIKKIVYDADGNISAMVLKTKKGDVNIVKVVVAGSKSISGDEDVLKGKNCRTVYCNNPNHPAGCGWQECN